MMDRYTQPPIDDCRCAPHPDPKHDPRCSPCEPPPVCNLECLVRPNFHCGQELTDDDLNALVRWTDRRLARMRYRDGWGVVCGLDICIDPRCPTRIKVSPGYAVSCCGDDLVICDPVCIDLLEHCPDPCQPEGYDEGEIEKQEKEFAELMARQLGVGQLPFRLRSCKPVDICLEADERAVVSMVRPGAECGCGSNDNSTCSCTDQMLEDPCAVTRSKEMARLVVCKPHNRPDPVRKFCKEWEQAAHIKEEILQELEARKNDPKSMVEVLSRLKFCTIGVVDRILGAITAEDLKLSLTYEKEQVNLQALLFWYSIDRRLRLRARPCHECDNDKVCIARAWLFTGIDRQGRRICFIGWLDTADPVRRRLGPVRLPAPAGSVNLVELALGREPQDAALALSAAGIEVAGNTKLEGPLDSDVAERILSAPPFASWTDRATLVTGITCHGPRVVGWYLTQKTAVGTPVNTEVPSPPAEEEVDGRVDNVVKLDKIGPARAKDLSDNGIATVGDLIDTDRQSLVKIVSAWSNLGSDMTPDKLTDWLIEHAKQHVKGAL